jgi:hypothetical protein
MRPFRALPVLLGLAACAAEFTPRSVLEDLRVVALVADHPELGPASSVPPGDPAWDTVAIQAWDFLPAELRGVEVTWSFTFCPFSLGASAGYACAVTGPVCEPELAGGTHGAAETGASFLVDSATANPAQLALACLQSLAQGGGLPPTLPPELPPVAEVQFRYRVSGGGQSRDAVQLVPVRTGPQAAPTSLNRNPVIQLVEIGGVAAWPPPSGSLPPIHPGGEVEVRALLDPPEPYLDPAGRPISETLVVSFFTTAGRFDYDRAFGPDARVKLQGEKLPPLPFDAELWAVARDLRGGEAIAGPIPIRIEP